jgi:hypothetical protein
MPVGLQFIRVSHMHLCGHTARRMVGGMHTKNQGRTINGPAYRIREFMAFGDAELGVAPAFQSGSQGEVPALKR